MPTVPEYDSLQVQTSSVPTPRMDAPEAQDFAPRMLQETGDGLQSLGAAGVNIAAAVERQANQLRVDDALNQVKEQALTLTYGRDVGYTNLKGKDALERPDGKPLADEYVEQLDKTIADTSASLGNDAQRLAFQHHANDIRSSFHAGAMQHEAQEFTTYGLSVSEGVQATAQRDIALNWNNPDAVNSAIDRIGAEVHRQGELLGKSAEWQEAQARKETSAGHKLALLGAIQANNLTYAGAYLKRYSSSMDAEDILTVQGHLTKEVDNHVGVAVAADVMRGAQSRIQVSEGERAFNIALGAESGNRQFTHAGQTVTSPAGAVGAAQIMPGSGPDAAKAAGLQWDPKRAKSDPAYNRALGMGYFEKLLQDNGGDLAKAYAAYNAGPKAVQDAVDAAEKQGAAVDGAYPTGDWLSRLPSETQSYVRNNVAAFNAGDGQPKRMTFEEVDAKLRTDPRLASDPVRYKIARDEAKTRYEEQTQAIKQRDDSAVADAMRALEQNGGRYSALPPAVRSAIPAKEVDGVIAFGQKIAKGDDVSSMWLYNKLATNPTYLARVSDDEFYALRKELSESDFKHFAGERDKLIHPKPGTNGPGDLNTQAIKQTLDERMRTLGIDPTPKDDGGSDAARVGAIRQFVDQYFMGAQQQAGKKFTDTEVAQHIDRLFATSAEFRQHWYSLGKGSAPMLSMRASDIDSVTRDGLKASFARNGITNPTDAQILGAYWNLKARNR